MNQFNARKAVFVSAIFFALIANANGESRHIKCIEKQYSTTQKKIHLDIQFTDPIPAGREVTFDFSKSIVPSGQMKVHVPVMNPNFKATSSTDTSYSYIAPDSAGDYFGGFVIEDTFCQNSERINALKLPVR